MSTVPPLPHLVCPGRCLPGLLLEAGDDGVQAVSLALQGLHLLTDRVHGWNKGQVVVSMGQLHFRIYVHWSHDDNCVTGILCMNLFRVGN